MTRPGQRLRVKGDGTRLAQVVANLLNNAAKYTPERGQIAVSIEAEEEAAGTLVDLGDRQRRRHRARRVPEIFNLFAQADTTPGARKAASASG